MYIYNYWTFVFTAIVYTAYLFDMTCMTKFGKKSILINWKVNYFKTTLQLASTSIKCYLYRYTSICQLNYSIQNK